MGSEERRGALFNCKEEGRDHSGWKKEAFAANEGSVGCTEEIDQEEVNVFTRRPAGRPQDEPRGPVANYLNSVVAGRSIMRIADGKRFGVFVQMKS
jgi:hypothetical protein